MSANDPPSRYNVSAEDLQRYEWQRHLADNPGNLFAFCDALDRLIKDCDAQGDVTGGRAYRFIHCIASFMPNFDLRTNAFQPYFAFSDGRRGPMGEDLVASDLATLRAILEGIQDSTFRARVGDVLWECKKDHAAARIAISAYLQAADAVGDWDPSGHGLISLRRATQLAAKLGFRQPLHHEIVAGVRQRLAASAADPAPANRLLAHALMLILLDTSDVPPIEYAALSEKLAANWRGLNDHGAAFKYHDLAGQWYRKGRKDDEIERCRREAAEDLAAMAEASMSLGERGYGEAEHHLEKGIHLLRAARGDEKRIEELVRRFIEIQGLAAKSSNPTTLNFSDVPGFTRTTEEASAAAAAHVQGYDFETAVARLVHISEETNVEELEKEYRESAAQSPFLALIGAVAVNATGQTTGRMGPGLRGGAADEESLPQRLTQHAVMFRWKTKAGWFIEPARMAILREHPVRIRDLLFLVQNNEFIPPGHEPMYLRGFQTGFFGDWLAAMSFLLPQVEASLRHVLKSRGIVTVSVGADETQEEFDINRLLYMPEMEQIFGRGTVFDLRGLLIERFGHNLRNRDAHGLMPEGAFYTEASPHLWWLLLRLCYFGCRFGSTVPA